MVAPFFAPLGPACLRYNHWHEVAAIPGETILNEHEFHASHAALQDALKAIPIEVGAAEAHGTLCGLMAAGCDHAQQSWVQHLFSECEEGVSVKQTTLALLSRLHTESAAQLSDSDYGFYLLLPSADSPLDVRIAALAGWCRGFVYGIGLACPGEDTHWAGDTREAIQDFTRIATAKCVTEIEDEQSEQDFQELAEYVRVATLLVCENFRGAKSHTTVH